jgi:hypothetical protein
MQDIRESFEIGPKEPNTQQDNPRTSSPLSPTSTVVVGLK